MNKKDPQVFCVFLNKDVQNYMKCQTDSNWRMKSSLSVENKYSRGSHRASPFMLIYLLQLRQTISVRAGDNLGADLVGAFHWFHQAVGQVFRLKVYSTLGLSRLVSNIDSNSYKSNSFLCTLHTVETIKINPPWVTEKATWL